MNFGSKAKDVKSKPKGALIGLLASAPVSTTPEEEEAPEVDHGFRAVAKAFGIPPEREAAAQAALSQYIRACSMSEPDEDDYGDEKEL